MKVQGGVLEVARAAVAAAAGRGLTVIVRCVVDCSQQVAIIITKSGSTRWWRCYAANLEDGPGRVDQVGETYCEFAKYPADGVSMSVSLS